MKIKIEFCKAKSHAFPFVVRLAKMFPSYKEYDDEGIRFHSVEFDFKEDREPFVKIFTMVYCWKTTVFYEDGKLVSTQKISDMVFKSVNKGTCRSCRSEHETGLLSQVCLKCYDGIFSEKATVQHFEIDPDNYLNN